MVFMPGMESTTALTTVPVMSNICAVYASFPVKIVFRISVRSSAQVMIRSSVRI